MSWRVASLCDERKFGGSSKKQVIMYLADKASDDGRGIWCSKHTIAAFTEISLATIKRIVREFIQLGILIETGTRGCKHGEVKVYAIDLGTVATLPSLRAPEASAGTGVMVNPVHDDPATGVTMTPLPGSPRPPNHPKTILKPPCRPTGGAEVPDGFDDFWELYPQDRRRRRAGSEERYAAALAAGATPEGLREAAAAYASETEEFTRSRVCLVDNWLRDGRWRRHLDERKAAADEKDAATQRSLVQVAEWIKSSSPTCRRLSRQQVEAVVAFGMVTPAELHLAGVAI